MPVPLSVQLAAGVKVPVAFEVNEMVPLGVIAVPGEVSVTVAVHELACATLTEIGEHVTAVVVTRGLTTMLAVPLLVACVAVAG